LIDALWLVATAALLAGLGIAYHLDLRAQNARCHARNNQVLRKFSMQLPDRQKLDLT
jgi:hypothetical protein